MIDTSFGMANGNNSVQIYYKIKPILSITSTKIYHEDGYVLHRWISDNFPCYFDTELYNHLDVATVNTSYYVCKLTGVDQL